METGMDIGIDERGLTEATTTFGDIIHDDPLKAAGLAALAYLALRVGVGVLRRVWRHRWLTASILATIAVAYIANKDEIDRFLDGATGKIGAARDKIVS